MLHGATHHIRFTTLISPFFVFPFVCLFGGGDEDGDNPLTYIINSGTKPLSGSCEGGREREDDYSFAWSSVCVC